MKKIAISILVLFSSGPFSHGQFGTMVSGHREIALLMDTLDYEEYKMLKPFLR